MGVSTPAFGQPSGMGVSTPAFGGGAAAPAPAPAGFLFGGGAAAPAPAPGRFGGRALAEKIDLVVAKGFTEDQAYLALSASSFDVGLAIEKLMARIWYFVELEEQGPLPGGNVPMAPGGPAAQPQPYRQLKVEDALEYLGQVKMKFERQPQIHKEVCACTRDARRSHVAPGAIVMDTLVRASRTRTRRHPDEISRARAPVAVPRHHEGVQDEEHRHV